MLGRCALIAARRVPAVATTAVRGLAAQKSFVRKITLLVLLPG